jgi:hypothetical protein
MRLLAFLLLPGSLRLDFDSPAASVTGVTCYSASLATILQNFGGVNRFCEARRSALVREVITVTIAATSFIWVGKFQVSGFQLEAQEMNLSGEAA